jgi:hypothetical protein
MKILNMKILKSESGQTLVLVALFMALAAVGFLALAIDVGAKFSQKRMAQAAADAAALAYAEEISYGASTTAAQNAANAMATLNGFNTSASPNPATATVSTPASGNFTGSAYTQITVSKPIATGFMAAFSSRFATLTVSGSAIAGGGSTSQTCVCLENTSGESLNMSNNSKLSASTCGVIDDSSSSGAIGIVGSANLTALSIGTVSTNWDNSSYINNGGSVTSSNIVQGITTKCNPTMPTAPSYSTCNADPGGSYGTFSWGPASASSVICYNALTIGSNGSTCTLNPGTYVINGGELHFESGSGGFSNYGGNGVFFYLTNGASLVIDNGANVNLVSGGGTESGGGTAPTVGAYNGVLFYQAASDTSAMSIQGGSSSYIAGSIYAPGAALSLGNGSTMNLNGGIVAASMTLAGGGTIDVAATTNEGSMTVGGSPKLVQ